MSGGVLVEVEKESECGRMVVAIDPGDVHVGWAHWVRGEVQADEIDERECLERLVSLRAGDYVVAETFVLYPGQAREQSWSPMKTARLLGKIELICEQRGVEYSEQGADIKNPTRGHLRQRGIQQVGVGTHARDAELHLYRWMLQRGRRVTC